MIINILGCMGIGKTTILKSIEKKYPHVKIYYEKFWNNPHLKKNFTYSQLWFLEFYDDILTSISEASEDDIIVLDQVFFNSAYLDAGLKANLITVVERQKVIQRQYEIARKHEETLKKIKNFLLVDRLENIFEKIKERARNVDNIDYAYISVLNYYFDEIFKTDLFKKYGGSFAKYDVENLLKGGIPDVLEILIEKHECKSCKVFL